MTAATAVFRPNAVAAITGAASGVGLAVAKLCASKSMKVILIDNNPSALEQAKTSFDGRGEVETHSMDVTSFNEWQKFKTYVEEKHKQLDFLHLNAGIGLKGDWSDNQYFRKIFDVNFFGVVNGVNTFVSHFDGNNSTAKSIVITGSKQGITNPPGNPAYNASKAAVKTLAEHLSFDLAKSSPQTSVHLLVPGWTFTGLTGAGASKSKPDGAWSPEQVADYLYAKMSDNKFYVMCPDNDVDWETDRKRMMWTTGDIVYERLPQSRWREQYAEESKTTMSNMTLGSKQ